MKTKRSEIEAKSMEEIHAKQREIAAQILKEANISFKYFTCDNCEDAYDCMYAFDPYNTDGDCLADK